MLVVRFDPPKGFTVPGVSPGVRAVVLFVGLSQLGQLLEGGGDFGGLMLDLVGGVLEVVGRVFEFADKSSAAS